MVENIQLYVDEFVSVVDRIKKDGDSIESAEYFFVKKEKVMRMLRKDLYDTELNKLKVWRDLKWIDADEHRFTKRVVHKKTGKRVRCIKISQQVYRRLKMFPSLEQ